MIPQGSHATEDIESTSSMTATTQAPTQASSQHPATSSPPDTSQDPPPGKEGHQEVRRPEEMTIPQFMVTVSM